MTFILRLIMATNIWCAVDLNLLRKRTGRSISLTIGVEETYGELVEHKQIKRHRRKTPIPPWWVSPKPIHKSKVSHRSTKSMSHRDLDQQKIRRKCTNGNL